MHVLHRSILPRCTGLPSFIPNKPPEHKFSRPSCQNRQPLYSISRFGCDKVLSIVCSVDLCTLVQADSLTFNLQPSDLHTLKGCDKPFLPEPELCKRVLLDVSSIPEASRTFYRNRCSMVSSQDVRDSSQRAFSNCSHVFAWRFVFGRGTLVASAAVGRGRVIEWRGHCVFTVGALSGDGSRCTRSLRRRGIRGTGGSALNLLLLRFLIERLLKDAWERVHSAYRKALVFICELFG